VLTDDITGAGEPFFVTPKLLQGFSRVYPSWAFQPPLIAYLGYDPFTETGLKTAKSNEPSCVAFFSPDAPLTMGQKIRQHRLKMRKTRKQLASEFGVSQKTLWGWETDRWKPSTKGQKQISIFLSGCL
jgi:DNA-binding XRE family transcriptional regulator